MNKEELIHQLTIIINEFFIEDNPNYTYKLLNKCYCNNYNDIYIIGTEIIKNLNLNSDNLDIIKSPDYFIFNYRNYYIIINFNNNIWNMQEYKVMLVKTRNEALTYRYGD